MGLADDLHKLKRMKTILSSNAASIVPVQADLKVSSAPTMLLFSRRGQPFTWCPFDKKEGNFNVTVTGKPGSGKSVWMQELVTGFVAAGSRVIVVDNGRSFLNSSKFLNGDHIEFRLDSGVCLNPFSIVDEKKLSSSKDAKMDVLLLLANMIEQMAYPVKDVSGPAVMKHLVSYT